MTLATTITSFAYWLPPHTGYQSEIPKNAAAVEITEENFDEFIEDIKVFHETDVSGRYANNTKAAKNCEAISLDVPAKIINGRTLVPVRFISDCFGVKVDWDGNARRVILTK